MTIHEQAYNIVMDEMMEGRKYMNVDSYIAKQNLADSYIAKRIVQALFDAGLIQDHPPDHRHRHEVPDEDVWRGDR